MLHEPFLVASRNASEKYLAPEACASAVMLGVPGAR